MVARNFKRLMSIFLLSSLALLFAGSLPAAEPVSKSRFGGVAIGARDTVAYHSLVSDPHEHSVEGSKSLVVEWKGAKWRFASKDNSEKFKADPERYSPAYNGFCANALSLRKGLLRTDGTHWEIFGDKLYLFYADEGRDRWVAATDIEDYIDIADEEWLKLSKP